MSSSCERPNEGEQTRRTWIKDEDGMQGFQLTKTKPK